MTNVNTVISDRSIDRAAMRRLYEKKSVGKVVLIIDGHAIRVDKLIKSSALQGKPFNVFLKELDKEIAGTMAEAYTTSSNDLVNLYKAQSSYTTATLSSTIDDVWRVKAPPRHIAAEVVLQTPIFEQQTLAESWGRIGRNEKVRIEAIIRQGIAEGQTEKAIADTVFKSGYGATRNQAVGLVVTATTHVYSEADHQVYKANEKALSGWQYVAVLDSRTTPLCSHLDGKIFPIDDRKNLPPRHWYCRSTTLPIVKSYEDLSKLEGVAQIRKRNLTGLTPAEVAYYDGQGPMKESYNTWLKRQPTEVQLRHLGDTKKLELFRGGQLNVDQFSTPEGDSVGAKTLNRLAAGGLGVPGDSRRFAMAKEKLDTLKLGAARPEEIYESPEIRKALEEYYLLQAGELDGTLSITNYRGTLIHNKKNTKARVLTSPPTEEQLKFNPINGRYEDSRMYQPNPTVFANTQRLVAESEHLKQVDKDFITEFSDSLKDKMSVNERAVVTENLRITMERFRKDAQPWGNLKAVLNNEMKFDVMNVSDYMETQIHKDADLLTKLKQLNYLDPVLGPTQLSTLSKDFLANIAARNTWEDRTAPRIGKELRNILDVKIPLKIRTRITSKELDKFYTTFAKRLGYADTPDRDQLAVQLGRDLYNKANRRGSRNEWFNLGVKILDDAHNKGFYELETYGVQKRRMKSKMGRNYFGPYYDTFAVNVRVVDPRLLNYAKLTRKVDLGYRIGVTDANPKNRLVIREGYKTYFVDNGALGYVDTRIPITSTSSFVNFPATAIDKNMADALNWAANAKYRVDPDFFDFSQKLLAFQDDKGKAKFYNDLNVYRTHIVERGDSYERFKAMQWFRENNAAFSNHPFLDHRARIYDSGLIGPQSGETFRPYLSTAKSKVLGVDGFLNLQDQIGAFLGGESDRLEGRYNSLSVKGRQQIAIQQRASLVKLGDLMRRGKPNDIRAVLEHPLMAEIEGEEQGKLMRFALEMSKINEHLRGGPPARVVIVTKELLSERQDVAGLARMLGVENNASPKYVGSPEEIIQSQADLIRMVAAGKIPEKELSNSLSWLHTTDVELTDVRRERATYKTFDHTTGLKFSAEKIAENEAKFVARSKGNTRKYIATQVVEELGELLEANLKASGVSPKAGIYKTIEAQKRALKAIRFGDDTVINDPASIYNGKTNAEAALLSARAAGLTPGKISSEQLLAKLNERLADELESLPKPKVPLSAKDPFAPDNLAKMNSYKTALALEQDASSSGAQIIALTTKNRQLAELSNVVPTNQKQRLYDEIAASTFNDPRFIELNKKLNLTEKDLRKGAKQQNMVECCHV